MIAPAIISNVATMNATLVADLLHAEQPYDARSSRICSTAALIAAPISTAIDNTYSHRSTAIGAASGP